MQYSVVLAGLTASSFNYVSSSKQGDDYTDGSTVPYLSAAHVQGIAGGDSGWVAIPEPASISLIGLVTGGIYFARRFFIA